MTSDHYNKDNDIDFFSIWLYIFMMFVEGNKKKTREICNMSKLSINLFLSYLSFYIKISFTSLYT